MQHETKVSQKGKRR